MYSVESGSMEPNLTRGDLVFVMSEERLRPTESVSDTGIVTHRVGTQTGYKTFGRYGDVIVYSPNGGHGTPVIHRAMFWVNESENWYDKANPKYVQGSSCEAISNCPAPNSGFITLGDANMQYDQTSGISRPVRPAWVVGTGETHVPYAGYVNLAAG